MFKTVILSLFSVIFIHSANAQRPPVPQSCTEAQMKAARRMDMRTDTGLASSNITNELNTDLSTVSFSSGFSGSANTTVYFNGPNNTSCSIKVVGVVISFQLPHSFLSAPSFALTMPLLMGCAAKFTRVPGGAAALSGMDVSASNGKTLGDMGIFFNAATSTINLSTQINHPALGEFGCGG